MANTLNTKMDVELNHVAIIMDGNGRWANKHHLPRTEGHRYGAKQVEVILNACKKKGIKYLTLYAFSTENWKRPKNEINALMKLLDQFIKEHKADFHKQKIRLRTIGDISTLPVNVKKNLSKVVNETSKYTARHLVLALNYGARTELTQACRTIAQQLESGRLRADDITEQTINNNLYAPDIPDPELLIRTSGEMRISNFLLWQISYTEFYFTKTFWPDFGEKEFFEILNEYKLRQRRFGSV
jgi:undecaprenyl diphosphate synthase